jgi:hypothetical protein
MLYDETPTPLEFFPIIGLGQRGSGKTFETKNSALNYIKRGGIPHMYIFKRNGKIEKLSPFELADKEDWSKNEKPVDKKPKIKIYDDIHYICESVIKGTTDISILIKLFEEIVEFHSLNGKVILLTDALIGRYADIIDNRQFDELIERLGVYSQNFLRALPHKECIELKSKQVTGNFSGYIVTKSHNKMQNSIKKSDKDVDLSTWLFLEGKRITPRAIVNFINIFEGENITYSKVIKKAIERIINSDLSKKDASFYLKELSKSKRFNDTKLRDIQKAKYMFIYLSDFMRYCKEWFTFGDKNSYYGETKLNLIEDSLRCNLEKIKKYDNVDASHILNYDADNMAAEYDKLLTRLRRVNAPYQPNHKIMARWKGNYSKAYRFLMKLDEKERQSIWDNPANYLGIKNKIHPFEIFYIVFGEQLKECFYFEDMLKVARNVKKEE